MRLILPTTRRCLESTHAQTAVHGYPDLAESLHLTSRLLHTLDSDSLEIVLHKWTATCGFTAAQRAKPEYDKDVYSAMGGIGLEGGCVV